MIQFLSRLLVRIGPFVVVTLIIRILWVQKAKKDFETLAGKEENRQRLSQNNQIQDYDYEIKSSSLILIIFLICLAVYFFGMVLIWINTTMEHFSKDFWLCMGIANAYGAICIAGILNVLVWYVRVTGNDIEFRSTFGIIHHYRFEDVTRGVYKRSGALRIYAGDKRLFTFDDNIAFGIFERQMKRRGIPIDKTAIEGKKKRLYESDITYPHKKKKKKKR